MKGLILALALVVLSGCSTKATEPDRGASAPAPIRPSTSAQSEPPTSQPSTGEQDATTSKNMTSRLVPHKNDRYGVSFSYPENLNKPEIPQTGLQALKLDLGNGEISIYREQAKPGKSLADLAKENIDANTKASNGRIVSKDLGKQTLGGEDAWVVQRYFASAAGRYDAVQYFVLAGGFQYSVACGTKQGPPVVAWSAVEPVCQRILATIQFEP